MFRHRIVLSCLLALPLVAARPALSRSHLDDTAILATFDQVNGFDIETARLGAVRGSSETIRALAADVLRDHSMVVQMARDLGIRAGIKYQVPTDDPASRTHQAAMTELGKLTGQAFDAAYLKHEVAFHDAAVRAVKEVLLPSATNPELRSLLETVLPGFEHHLAMTRALARQAGVR